MFLNLELEYFSNSNKSVNQLNDKEKAVHLIPEYVEEDKITFLNVRIVVVSNKGMLGDILSKQLALDLARSIANFDNFVLEQEFVLKSDIIKKSATIIKQIDKIHEKYAAEHRKPVIIKEEPKPIKVENPEIISPVRENSHKAKANASPNPKSKVLVVEE